MHPRVACPSSSVNWSRRQLISVLLRLMPRTKRKWKRIGMQIVRELDLKPGDQVLVQQYHQRSPLLVSNIYRTSLSKSAIIWSFAQCDHHLITRNISKFHVKPKPIVLVSCARRLLGVAHFENSPVNFGINKRVLPRRLKVFRVPPSEFRLRREKGRRWKKMMWQLEPPIHSPRPVARTAPQRRHIHTGTRHHTRLHRQARWRG